MKPVIAVALSGGIDSLVAAHLLGQKGYRIIGLHFLTGFETALPADDNANALDKAQKRLKPIAEQLHISIKVIDLTSEFQEKIVDYFVRTYQSGLTPNPCLVCNPRIKFDLLARHARDMGATALATGHYARRKKNLNSRWHLHKGIDDQKDQSYFLSRLTQTQLAFARFPLGKLHKRETIAIARQNGLHPIIRQESQDICFIKNSSYGDFLRQQPGFKAKPGPIVNMDGRIIGTHQGLHLFTVGQRRGINCPDTEPYYVVRLDPNHNRLVVGFKQALNSMGCRISKINWLSPPPAVPVKAGVRVRYRHREVMATIAPQSNTEAVIRFDAPQKSITPGQGAVFYNNDLVLGGGWITEAYTALSI